MAEPQGVTAVLTNGIRIPCQVIRNGHDTEGYPKYRIVAEVDWRLHRVVRVEVRHWPDNVALALDLPGITPDEAAIYAAQVKWVEVK